MMGKTGTTEEYKSAAYVGATPDYAGAVQVFNDSTSPQGICIGSGLPRLCPEGDIYGGTLPAATWFDTMTKIHAGLPERPLPEVEERYQHGDGRTRVPDEAAFRWPPPGGLRSPPRRSRRPRSPRRPLTRPAGQRGVSATTAPGRTQRMIDTSALAATATQPAVAAPLVTCTKNALPPPGTRCSFTPITRA